MTALFHGRVGRIGLVIALSAMASCWKVYDLHDAPATDAPVGIVDAPDPVADAPAVAFDGPLPVPAPVNVGCRPYRVIPALQAKFPYQGANGTVDPVCTIDPSGAVAMTYQPLSCGALGWWAGCQFAANIDLSAFDDQMGRGQGIIAMSVCVANLVVSSVDLRYGSAQLSDEGRTKFLPAIRAEERFSGTGCRLAYLAPEDACYSQGHCGAQAGCAPGAPGAPDTCDTFARSRLTIMNEFCSPSGAPPSGPSTVTVEQVTYYPQACLCHTTADCAPPSVCRRDGWPTGATCNTTPGADCPGVCAP
jgi:hypothetical protein